MNLKSHHLTQLLNLHLGISFSDLIKNYRIDEAIRLLQENKDLKIINLVFETGFQSKSAFNSAFKEITGMTPQEYRSHLAHLK